MTTAGGAAGRKILVVDDDADIVRVIRRMLEESGYKVETAASGSEALEKISFARPEVILLDLMMPRMDGIEALRRIRAVDADIKVVMITAYGGIGTYIDAMEWGATGYVNKPFDRDQLLQAIQRVST